MMGTINVRFVYRASFTPIMELELDTSITLGALRQLVKERLVTDETCLVDVFVKVEWYAEVMVRNAKKRVVLLTPDNDEESLSAFGFADNAVVYLDGPLVMPGTHKTGTGDTADISRGGTKHIFPLLHCLFANGLVSYLKEEEKECRTELREAEDSNRAGLTAGFETSSTGKAMSFLAMHPGKPHNALWQALCDPACSAAVAMTIIRSQGNGKPKANLKAKSMTGDSAIIVAGGNGFDNVIKYLLDNTSCVNESSSSTGFTALHYAVNRGHYSTVELLVANGADLKAKTDSERGSKAPFQMLDPSAPDHKRLLALLTPK